MNPDAAFAACDILLTSSGLSAREYAASRSVATPEPLMRPAEVWEYLGISRAQFYAKLNAALPHIEVAGVKRYRLQDVTAYISTTEREGISA